MRRIGEFIQSPTGDRVFGLARAVMYGGITYLILANKGVTYDAESTAIPLAITGTLLVADGLADLVTGEHHHLMRYIWGDKDAN